MSAPARPPEGGARVPPGGTREAEGASGLAAARPPEGGAPVPPAGTREAEGASGLAAAQAPVEATPEQWTIVSRTLREHLPEREVWAFGSRARRTAKPHSDLDLCIRGVSPVGLHRLAALQEAFSESDLPWSIDLIEWATLSETFRRIVEADHVVVQQPARR